MFSSALVQVADNGFDIVMPFLCGVFEDAQSKIDNVVYMEKRIIDLDSPPLEIIASDQKRLVVDAFGRYKIIDPLLFFQAVGSVQDISLIAAHTNPRRTMENRCPGVAWRSLRAVRRWSCIADDSPGRSSAFAPSAGWCGTRGRHRPIPGPGTR